MCKNIMASFIVYCNNTQCMSKMSFTLQTIIIIINLIHTKAITVPIKHCLLGIQTAI